MPHWFPNWFRRHRHWATLTLQVGVILGASLLFLWAYLTRLPAEVSYHDANSQDELVTIEVAEDAHESNGVEVTGKILSLTAEGSERQGVFEVQIPTTRSTLQKWKLRTMPVSAYVTRTTNQPHILASEVTVESSGKLLARVEAIRLKSVSFSGSDAPKSLIFSGTDVFVW